MGFVGGGGGGRIALAYAFRYRDEIEQLILESSGVGIAEESERVRRYQSDRQLADQLAKNGIVWFQKYWTELKIFTTQQTLSQEVRVHFPIMAVSYIC